MTKPRLSIFFALLLSTCTGLHAQVADRITGIKTIEAKLDSIQIPALDISKKPFNEVINLLIRKSVENDHREKDINKLGVNIIANLGGGENTLQTPVSLKLPESSLRTALKAASDAVGAKFRVERNAVIVMPLSDDSNVKLIKRTYRVPLAFPEPRPAATKPKAQVADETPAPNSNSNPPSDPFGGGGGESDPFGGAPDPFGSSSESVVVKHWSTRLDEKKDAKSKLTKSGIIFGKGATATYNQKTSILTVQNTAVELDRVQQLVDTINLGRHLTISKKLKQIRIPSLELNETDDLETALSFLSSKSCELDFHEAYPYHKGIRFFVDPNADKAFKNKPITIRLVNVPLGETLRYIVELAGAKYQIGAEGIKVLPK